MNKEKETIYKIRDNLKARVAIFDRMIELGERTDKEGRSNETDREFMTIAMELVDNRFEEEQIMENE